MRERAFTNIIKTEQRFTKSENKLANEHLLVTPLSMDMQTYALVRVVFTPKSKLTACLILAAVRQQNRDTKFRGK